jgi:hypothetical protein
MSLAGGHKPQEEKMAEAESRLSRHDLEAKIVKRCWEDEAFRKEFTADPTGAFTKYLEIPAASLPKIVIHEESAGSWHILLPHRPQNADELSEQDLETIAGGETPYFAQGAKYSAAITGAASAVTMGVTAGLSATLQKGW